MANSFGAICDGWVEKNDGYKIDWSYEVGNKEFAVRLHTEKDLTLSDTPYIDISTKASIPDTEALSPYIVEVSLNVLKAQLDLFKAYGIRI